MKELGFAGQVLISEQRGASRIAKTNRLFKRSQRARRSSAAIQSLLASERLDGFDQGR